MRPDTKGAVQRETFEIVRPVRSGMSDRPRITLEGANDVKDRVACALSSRMTNLTIDRYRYNFSKLAAQCTGDLNGKRFFAKILLADPYPIPARFSAPWEKSGGSKTPARPVGEQIEAEWNMTLKMRAYSGDDCVPAPLGRSVPARTIVWEEAKGKPLVRLVKWSRWNRSNAAAGARALFQAGRWLNRVHKASHQGTEAIDIHALTKHARDFTRGKGPNVSRYDRAVPKILEAFLPEIGCAGIIDVPVAFTHGDFCLSNLIGGTRDGRLAVVDFELCDVRPVYHDLFALISELQSQFLNPLVPKFVIRSWQDSFWAGYGPTSPQIRAFVKALALARIFYHDLFRLLTRRQRKGWIAGVNAQLYRALLEPVILNRRLNLPREFCTF
jgi:Phosphotransferase enzyme family